MVQRATSTTNNYGVTVYTHSLECDCGRDDAEIACSSRVGFSVNERSKQRTTRDSATCTLILELLEGDEMMQEELGR